MPLSGRPEAVINLSMPCFRLESQSSYLYLCKDDEFETAATVPASISPWCDMFMLNNGKNHHLEFPVCLSLSYCIY